MVLKFTPRTTPRAAGPVKVVALDGGPLPGGEPPSSPTLLEKLWLPVAAAVIAAWGGLSYFLFTNAGWWGRGAAAGICSVIAAGALLIVRTGARQQQDIETADAPEFERRAA